MAAGVDAHLDRGRISLGYMTRWREGTDGIFRAYRDWLSAGRPYTLIRPARPRCSRVLRGYGLTVYDYPDDAHLQATHPRTTRRSP